MCQGGLLKCVGDNCIAAKPSLPHVPPSAEHSSFVVHTRPTAGVVLQHLVAPSMHWLPHATCPAVGQPAQWRALPSSVQPGWAADIKKPLRLAGPLPQY